MGYLDEVDGLFQDAADISETEVVIAVPKGNPRNIATIADLAAPGLRLAVGRPKQCTIGVLTRQLLRAQGLLNRLMPNVVAETCSSGGGRGDRRGPSVDADLRVRGVGRGGGPRGADPPPTALRRLPLDNPLLVTRLLQIAMFGMGATLTAGDFVRILQMPKGILVGAVPQFTTMPLLGWAVSRALGPAAGARPGHDPPGGEPRGHFLQRHHVSGPRQRRAVGDHDGRVDPPRTGDDAADGLRLRAADCRSRLRGDVFQHPGDGRGAGGRGARGQRGAHPLPGRSAGRGAAARRHVYGRDLPDLPA